MSIKFFYFFFWKTNFNTNDLPEKVFITDTIFSVIWEVGESQLSEMLILLVRLGDDCGAASRLDSSSEYELLLSFVSLGTLAFCFHLLEIFWNFTHIWLEYVAGEHRKKNEKNTKFLLQDVVFRINVLFYCET